MTQRYGKRTGKYRSSFEPQIAKILSHHKPQYKYDYLYETETFTINIPKKYKPDFVITMPSGVVKVIECKGYFPQEDRDKVLSFVEQYPEIDFLIVFERNNPVHGNPKFRYSNWCEKNGIKWAIKEVPEDFLTDETASHIY